jgi:hypothetical protein
VGELHVPSRQYLADPSAALSYSLAAFTLRANTSAEASVIETIELAGGVADVPNIFGRPRDRLDAAHRKGTDVSGWGI